MSAQAIQAVGSALLHFFWQGAALAVLLLITISFTRNARVRYGLGVCTLALMALCPLLTLLFLEKSPAASVAASVLDNPIVSPAVSNISVALNTAAPVTSFDLLSCLVWIWCSGVCLLGVRAFGGWLMLQKLRRTAQEAIPPALLERCRRLQQRVGISALVRYALSDVVDAPAVLGWFRPVVLVPISAMAGLSTEQLEAIIAHELAHVRRYDALVNLFQIAVETLLFYHPAIWWVNRVIRTERENCCDDIAVAVCGNAGEYARALATIGGTRPNWVMAANGGALKARVGRLLGMQKMTHGIPRAGLAVLALMCASCIVVAAGAFKQDVPSVPPLPPPPPVASIPSEPPVPLEPPIPSQPPVPSEPSVAPEPPNAPEPPPQSDSVGAWTRQSERDVERSLSDVRRQVERAARRSRIEEMRRSIASMKRRYTDDYPDLRAVREQLAALMAHEREEQGLSGSEQKTDEHLGSSYIDSMESAGLSKLSVDDLISLKIQGVTGDYVRQVKAAGFDPTVHDLISLKVQGVSPEYIRDIHATGLKPSVHELVGMKIQGVTPEFVRALQSAGLGDLRIHDFISARIQGVTPEFIEKVRSHGFKDLTLRQLINLRMADVF